MKNILLQDNLKKDQMKYYQQQLLDRTKSMKKAVCCLGLIMFVCDFIETQFIFPKDFSTSNEGYTRYIKLAGYFLSFICYYISIFKIFENNNPRVFRIRYILIWLSVLFYSSGQFLDGYYKYVDRIQANSNEKWMYAVMRARNDIWIALFVDILIPVWYLKLIVPTTPWLALLIAYYEGGLQHKEIVWITFSLATIFTAGIWGIKAYNSRKAFISNSNAEAWNGVHKYILDKIPDSIAIIDTKTKILYSNLNFQALCEDDLEKLSQKLINIKKSENSLHKSATFQSQFETKPEPKEELNFPQKHIENTASELPLTFARLIETTMASIEQGTAKSNDYLVYDSKLAPNENSDSSSLRSYQIRIGPLQEYGKAILILSDTTQRDIAISLETTNLYKDRLLATVSHDLRAPIMGSLIFLENTIQHEAVPEFIKEQHLIPAHRSCRFLLHLVNDILDFSLINAKKLRMSFESLSIVETIKNCHQLLETHASFKGISFPLELDNQLPFKFTTDHNRLSQILINLLTNAIKFTFQGEVRLSVEVIEGSRVEIKVSDTGIGIKEEDQHKLFKEFAKIQNDNKDINPRGIGLGLVIANKFAKKLGPKEMRQGLKVNSTYGKGTTFSFILESKASKEASKKHIELCSKNGTDDISYLINIPDREEDFLCQKIDEIDSFRNSYRSPYVKEQTLRLLTNLNSERASPFVSEEKRRIKEKILIVDDDPLNILALESVLKKYGVNSDKALNGQQAIERVLEDETLLKDPEEGSTVILKYTKNQSIPLSNQSEGYKMILMDYEMPGMNGIETSKRLTDMMKNNEIKWIPIIGCSGHTSEDFIKECYQNGMVEVISKPPKREELINLIEKYVGNI